MGTDASLMTLARAIAHGERARASVLLAATPELASRRFEVGATRQAAREHYLDEINHYVYSGDTALHIAAAAYEAVPCATAARLP